MLVLADESPTQAFVLGYRSDGFEMYHIATPNSKYNN